MNIQQAFGLKVQQLRKETGLSQEKFARSIDMDRTYLASVEAGKRNIPINNIKKIADRLRITISELFVGIEILDEDNCSAFGWLFSLGYGIVRWQRSWYYVKATGKRRGQYPQAERRTMGGTVHSRS